MKLDRKNIRLVFIIFSLAFIGFQIFKGFRELSSDMKNQLPSYYNLTKEDSCLISTKYLRKMKTIEIFRSKIRKSISLLEFDSAFNLIIFNIPLKDKSFPIFSIKDAPWKIRRSTQISYEVINNTDFTMQIQESVKPFPISNILFLYNGNVISQSISNDSVRYFRLNSERVSLSYSIQGPIDILFERKKRVLIDVLFLKRKNNLFYLMMFPKDLANNLPSDLLYNVVMKN